MLKLIGLGGNFSGITVDVMEYGHNGKLAAISDNAPIVSRSFLYPHFALFYIPLTYRLHVPRCNCAKFESFHSFSGFL